MALASFAITSGLVPARGSPLTEADVQALTGMQGVDAVVPIMTIDGTENW